MSLAPTKWFVTATVALVAVAVGNLSGQTPANNPACSPKPFRVSASADSRPHVYVGPSTVSPPTRIVYVKPEYPENFRYLQVNGLVVLEAQIEPDGHVCNARIVRSIRPLDQSAIDAVLKWRFTPAKLNGVAVPVVTTLTVNFTR